MAEVINLNDKYIDASSVYDVNQNSIQSDINYSALHGLEYRMYARGEASQNFNTYVELIQTDCRYSRGVYGSVNFASSSGNVQSGWHWFLYIPHRAGGNESDNHMYGALFLVPFWPSSYHLHIICYTAGNSYNIASY